MVHLRHLLLDIEVGSGARALHNQDGFNLGCRIHGEARIFLDAYLFAQVRNLLANELGSFVGRKHG